MSTDKKNDEDSITPSTRILNQMVGQLGDRRMLTKVEIDLLRKSKKEISEKIQSILKKKDRP